MERTYCFGCGAEIPRPSVPGMPICDDCRFRADPTRQAWMVRRHGQHEQGPYPRDAIEERIRSGLLEAGDEVCRPDGPWKPLDVHEDFRAWFCPGDAHSEARVEAAVSRTRGHAAADRQARHRVIAAVAGCIVIVAASLAAWRMHVFVVPSSWYEAVSGAWNHVYGGTASVLGRTGSEEQAEQTIPSDADLPARDVIVGLGVPRDHEPARLHFMRGRADLLAAPSGPPEDAIRELEAAVAADPTNIQALAALVEGWASTLETRPERNQRAVGLVARIDALDEEAPAGVRARAGLALASGSFPEALSLAERCIAVDPANLGCQSYHARALMGLGRWPEARSIWTGLVARAPHVPSWVFALATTESEEGLYRPARGRIDGLLASWPTNPGFLALSARIAFLTGDWARARDDGALALRADPSGLPTRILAVQAALSAGTPTLASDLLAPALADVHDRDQRRNLLFLSSHARRLAGDTEGAVSDARAALGNEPSWGPGALALALAHLQAYDLTSAEAVLKEAYADDLPPAESSNVHVALGRVYLDQARPKAAMASFERAVEVDADNPAARLGLAETYLVLANGPRALQAIRDIALSVVEQREVMPPFHLCPLPARDPEPLLRGLAGLTASDPSLESAVARAQGIVLVVSGERRRALPLLEAALRGDRQDAATRIMLARLAMAQERWNDADALLTPLLVNPECEALACALLGRVRSAGERHPDALSLLKRSVKLSDGTATYHRLLAEALFRSGDTAAGLEQARRAWQLDPQDWAAHRLVLELGPLG